MRKQVLSLLLTLVMIVGMIPPMTLSASEDIYEYQAVLGGVKADIDGMKEQNGNYYVNLKSAAPVFIIGAEEELMLETLALCEDENLSKKLTEEPEVGQTFYFEIVAYNYMDFDTMDFSQINGGDCSVTWEGYDVNFVKVDTDDFPGWVFSATKAYDAVLGGVEADIDGIKEQKGSYYVDLKSCNPVFIKGSEEELIFNTMALCEDEDLSRKLTEEPKPGQTFYFEIAAYNYMDFDTIDFSQISGEACSVIWEGYDVDFVKVDTADFPGWVFSATKEYDAVLGGVEALANGIKEQKGNYYVNLKSCHPVFIKGSEEELIFETMALCEDENLSKKLTQEPKHGQTFYFKIAAYNYMDFDIIDFTQINGEDCSFVWDGYDVNFIKVDMNDFPGWVFSAAIEEHELEYVAEKSADFENAGNKAYYTCECGKWFEDSAATKEITDKNSVVIERISTVKLSYNQKVYTGANIAAPTLTVKDAAGKDLIKGTDYTVTGLAAKKLVSRYTVKVTFKGSYSGNKTLYFAIVPKAPSSASANLDSVSQTASYNDVKFTWKASTGATGYFVYYKKGTGAWSNAISTTKTSYTKKDLSSGVKYTFKVVPYYKVSSGTKYYSTAQYRTASVYTLKKLVTPTVSKSGTKVKVKWTNINGESGYQISKSTSKTGTNIVSTYATTSGTYKILNATKGKTYYYKVRAYKTVSGKKIYGPWSAVRAYKR